MATQPTTITVRIGEPIAELPAHLGGPNHPADHWAAIAEACRRYPGKWRAVHIDLSESRRKTAARDIRLGHLSAFATGDWDAALRRGVLYIRFIADDSVPATSGFTLIDEADPR